MSTFKIGDRVRITKSNLGLEPGELGTVRVPDGTAAKYVLIETDRATYHGHNGDGLCLPGHGRWIPSSELENLNSDKPVTPLQSLLKDLRAEGFGSDQPIDAGNVIDIINYHWDALNGSGE